MARDFPIRIDLLKLNLPERTIRVLEKAAQIVQLVEDQSGLQTAVDALDTTVQDLDGTVAAADAAIVALDGRIDVYDGLAPFVRQDQGAAWSAATGTEARTALAAYTGQTISAIPTQAEVQAIDDALKAISQHLVAFINDARANGVLHE